MTIRIITAALLLFAAGAAAGEPVTERRSWTETYAVGASAPRLHVSNIWGSVQVRQGPPGEIRLSVDEVRSAPNAELFARSLKTLPLEIDASADGLTIQVANRDNSWNDFEQCRNCRVDYQFAIETPPGSIVDVGTVMDGKVEVAGVTGTVSARNVNGPIAIRDIENCDDVKSVNGSIRMAFSRAPQSNCTIETINGDITLDVPAGSGIDMVLDLFNGKVLSELPVTSFAPQATIEQVVDDGRTRYRIQQQAGLRIGAGGPVYTIASINGDVRVKQGN